MTPTRSRTRRHTGVLLAAAAAVLTLSGCSALPVLSGSTEATPGSEGSAPPNPSEPPTVAGAAPAQDCAAIVPILTKAPPLTLDGSAADYFTEYANSVTQALDASTNGEITATLTAISEQVTRASDVTTKIGALGDTSGLNPAQLLERAQQAAELAGQAKTVFADLTTQLGKLSTLCPQVK